MPCPIHFRRALQAILLSTCLIVGATTALQAQERAPIQAGYLYDFKADIDDGGDVSSQFFYAQGGIPLVMEEELFISLGASYYLNSYDFSGGPAGSFAALDPWHNVRTIGLGGFVKWKFADDWELFGIPSVRSTGESGANFGDTIGGGALIGVSYKFGDRLTLGPGIGYMTQIEDDASIFPIILVDWKITDSLSLTTGPTAGATLGPGLALNWQLNDALTFSFGARYEKLRFRLDEANRAAPGGVGEDRSIPVFGALIWQATDLLQASFIGGVGFGSSLRLEDTNGRGLIKTDYDPAPFVGVNLGITF
jgi:hypothetical protein